MTELLTPAAVMDWLFENPYRARQVAMILRMCRDADAKAAVETVKRLLRRNRRGA